jgi:hypothetical protein
MAGGDEFWRRRCRHLQENGGDGVDSGSPRLDSVGGEEEGGVAELPASQRSSGRLLAVAEDDGHGGVLGVCEVAYGRERE